MYGHATKAAYLLGGTISLVSSLFQKMLKSIPMLRHSSQLLQFQNILLLAWDLCDQFKHTGKQSSHHTLLNHQVLECDKTNKAIIVYRWFIYVSRIFVNWVFVAWFAGCCWFWVGFTKKRFLPVSDQLRRPQNCSDRFDREFWSCGCFVQRIRSVHPGQGFSKAFKFWIKHTGTHQASLACAFSFAFGTCFCGWSQVSSKPQTASICKLVCVCTHLSSEIKPNNFNQYYSNKTKTLCCCLGFTFKLRHIARRLRQFRKKVRHPKFVEADTECSRWV